MYKMNNIGGGVGGRGYEREREREMSCPVIGCHINIVDLLITGEYHAAKVGNSLQHKF